MPLIVAISHKYSTIVTCDDIAIIGPEHRFGISV